MQVLQIWYVCDHHLTDTQNLRDMPNWQDILNVQDLINHRIKYPEGLFPGSAAKFFFSLEIGADLRPLCRTEQGAPFIRKEMDAGDACLLSAGHAGNR
jgi:hypothetical protein